MRDRELVFGMLTLNMIVLAVLAVLVINLDNKLESAQSLNLELVQQIRQQTITQAAVIQHQQAAAELTGLAEAQRKSQRGFYEALSQGGGRVSPIERPQGWSDRYFNYLARTGILGQPIEVHPEGTGGSAD